MEDVTLKLDSEGDGTFIISEGKERLGEMAVSISGSHLTALHTEVFPGGEGTGLGKKLLDAVAAYAREHHLLVIAKCPFVHAQFKRHPQEYADIRYGDAED